MKLTVVTKVEDVKGMTYKELQALAKELNIKANQKKEVLVTLIEEQLRLLDEEDEMISNRLSDESIVEEQPKMPSTDILFEEDELSEETTQPQTKESSSSQPAYTKLIEFVNGTDLAVHYRVKGEDVIVGWSKDDFKMYIWSRRKGKRLTSYASMIRQFVKLKKGVHGDVGLVVKALGRIKRKPSKIVYLERQAKLGAASEASRQPHTSNKPNVSDESVSRPKTGGNPLGTNRGVDRRWLSHFRVWFEGTYDRQPTAQEIRDAWLLMLA